MEEAIGFFSQQDRLEERRENVQQQGPIWYNAENFNELKLIMEAAATENWDEETDQEQERKRLAEIQRQHRIEKRKKEAWE